MTEEPPKTDKLKPKHPKRNLTDKEIAALKPHPTGKRYDIADAVVPGLCVRVGKSGKRSFALHKRRPGAQHPGFLTLGTYGALTLADARAKARLWLEQINAGIDPVAEEERRALAAAAAQRNSFAAVTEDFIAEKLPSERKGKEVERDIRREFIPHWGRRPITEITPLDVRNVIKAVAVRGAPYAAHNLLVTARRLFSWAIDQHVYGLETSPCDRLKPKAIIGKKKSRTYVLSDDEIRALWKASGQLGYPYGPMYQLLLQTGQRRGEVAEASWPEFDLERRLWTIPAERMKMDRGHVVPLSDDAVEVLRSLPRFERGDFVFSHKVGKTPINGFAINKARLDTLIGGEVDWIVHDIRRTVRTRLSAIPGISDLVRELVIAHTKPGLHAVYDLHAYEDEKRFALDAWAAKLRSILEPTLDNVVTFRVAGQT
jgi:integrase